MTLATHTGNRATPVSRRGAQLYETQPQATRALLALEELPQLIWEPCCGRGAIVRELQKAGHEVIASDLYNYRWGHRARRDFLKIKRPPAPNITIVTNPPYGNETNAFITQALKLAPKVIFLLRVNALAGQRRQNLMNDHLARCYIFSRRLPMMHRDDYIGKKASSAMDFAWFVFERDCKQDALVRQIDWKDFE